MTGPRLSSAVPEALLERARRRAGTVRRYRPGRGVPGGGKLSSNESPLGPSPNVRLAIAGAGHEAHRYGTSGELRELLAARAGVEPARVVVTNGSDELCYLLATLFVSAGDPVVLSEPCYQIDELVTLLHEGEPRFVALRDGEHDLDAMAAAAADATVCWLPSPHNPTGRHVAPDDLDRFLAAVPPSCLVVLDEAYRDYVDPARRPDVGVLLGRHPNLVVQRTLSKAYALAGLRVGYALGGPELIAALAAVRPPFNVNVAALAGARAALSDTAWRDFGVELVRRERMRLEQLLASLGWEHFPSQANFVTVRPPDAAAAAAALLAERIVVRDGGDLGLPGWLRISIGTPAQMAVVRAVLSEQNGSR
jgi:histidinol-phosphate aminotransferase